VFVENVGQNVRVDGIDLCGIERKLRRVERELLVVVVDALALRKGV